MQRPSIRIGISTKLRLRISQLSVVWLLVIWLAIYLFVGVVFAGIYECLPCPVVHNGEDVDRFVSLLYFSFTTQSTVGYGDYAPQSYAQLFTVLQELFGIALNTMLLGLAVFKALKRSNPIVLPKNIVYDFEHHSLWLRFISNDADQLRDVSVQVELIEYWKHDQAVQANYDTRTSVVDLPFDTYRVMPCLRVFAIKTISNHGEVTSDPPGDWKKFVFSPLHLNAQNVKDSHLQVTLKGNFETTGDAFYSTQIYKTVDVRCGRYATNIDNNSLIAKPERARLEYLEKVFEPITSTTEEECRACPFHFRCQLDVARRVRNA